MSVRYSVRPVERNEEEEEVVIVRKERVAVYMDGRGPSYGSSVVRSMPRRSLSGINVAVCGALSPNGCNPAIIRLMQ